MSDWIFIPHITSYPDANDPGNVDEMRKLLDKIKEIEALSDDELLEIKEDIDREYKQRKQRKKRI